MIKRLPSEMKSLQKIETIDVVWFGFGGSDQKSGGRAEGVRVVDVEILFGRNKHIRRTVQFRRIRDKLEGPDWDGLDRFRGGTVEIQVEAEATRQEAKRRFMNIQIFGVSEKDVEDNDLLW